MKLDLKFVKSIHIRSLFLLLTFVRSWGAVQVGVKEKIQGFLVCLAYRPGHFIATELRIALQQMYSVVQL